MKTDQNIFLKLEPSDNIVSGVLVRIKVIEKRRATTKLVVSSVCSFGAITLTVFLAGDMAKEMHSSGFTEYAGLLFSDSRLVLGNFQQFSLALVESLPEVSTALILSSVFVLLISLRTFSKNLPRVRNSIHRHQTTLTA